jgi:hypothetical protein
MPKPPVIEEHQVRHLWLFVAPCAAVLIFHPAHARKSKGGVEGVAVPITPSHLSSGRAPIPD